MRSISTIVVKPAITVINTGILTLSELFSISEITMLEPSKTNVVLFYATHLAIVVTARTDMCLILALRLIFLHKTICQHLEYISFLVCHINSPC